jgi:hypothetical protein
MQRNNQIILNTILSSFGDFWAKRKSGKKALAVWFVQVEAHYVLCVIADSLFNHHHVICTAILLLILILRALLIIPVIGKVWWLTFYTNSNFKSSRKTNVIIQMKMGCKKYF